MEVTYPDTVSNLRSNGSFVRLFLGGLVTNAGDSVYFIAAMWLVHDLTGSTLFTGLAGFLVQGPSALGFLVGPLVDRWRLRRILVGTQFFQGVSVLLVPLAAFVDVLSVWFVLGLMPILAFVNQFVYASRSTVLPLIVSDDRLVRANSLMATAFQGLDMFFNGASGILVAAIGAVSLYLVDSVTFFVAAILFFGITISGRTVGGEESIPSEASGTAPAGEEDDTGATDHDVMADGDPGPEEDGDYEAASETGSGADDDGSASDDAADDEEYVDRLRGGIAYIRGSALVPMLLGLTVVNFVFGTGLAVFPAFAADRGGPEAFGFFMAAFAAGNLVGALAANLVEDLPYGLLNAASKILAGVLLAGAVLVGSLVPTIGLLFAGFVFLGMGVVMSSSLRQSAVANDFLGRVSSVSQSISTAALPVGSLVGGVIAAVVGVDAILVAVAASISLYGVYFLVHPQLRTLPPVSEADEAALGL